MKKIAVVGGGAGGLIFSSKLANEMYREIRSGGLKITVFDSSRYHEFQPGYLGVAFRGKSEDKVKRLIDELVFSGVEHVKENASTINLEEKYLLTDKTGRRFDFDQIVISTGAVPDYDQVPGLKAVNHDFHTNAERSADVFKAISKVRSGRVVVGIGGLPYKCPPSPNEAAFMVDEYFRKKGIRDKVQVTMVTPYLRAYPAEPISEVITPLYEDRDIELVTGFNLDTVDGEKKELLSLEGDGVSYDELILVPPHSTVPAVRSSDFVDEDGWIITDKRDLHIKDYDYAFSLGDNTNIPISKAGVEAHLQGIVVAENIASELSGSSERCLFTGRTQCSMETGRHQATFVIGTYERGVDRIKPSTMNYMEKKFMERIYWASLKGGYEWLFKYHFGDDYMERISGAGSRRDSKGPHGY